MNDIKDSAGQTFSFQKLGYILMPFLLYFAVHDLAQIVLALLVNVSFGILGEEYVQFVQANAASVNGILNGLSLLIGAAAVLPRAMKEIRHEAEGREPDKEENRGKVIPAYILLLIGAVFLALGMNVWMNLTGLTQTSDSYTEIATRQHEVAFGVGILLYGVISPLAEEVVFRGLIYNRMKRIFSVTVSIVACGVLFGVYHGNMVQGIYGCVIGIAITLAYEWYGSFLAPLLFHGAANIGVFIASYHAGVYAELLTPLYGMCFLAISFVSFGIIYGMGRRIQKGNKEGNDQ